MYLTVPLRLLPSDSQIVSLLDTMRRFNAACNHVAGVAFEQRSANKFALQKMVYHRIRSEFSLPADLAIRVIAQVCEAYKRDRTRQPCFRETAAIPYTFNCCYSFKGIDRVSLLVSPKGREIMPFVMGKYQEGKFGWAKKQADLVLKDDKWYLYVSVDVPEAQAQEAKKFLGIDLGITNILTDSGGERYTGAEVERHRKKHFRARASFQRRGTRSAKRRLRKLSGKQSRYQRQVNHCISKAVVRKAKTLRKGIALEDLKRIRERTEKTAGRKFRRRLSNWSFSQLRIFIAYKARLVGVPVVLVDPRYTSQTCSKCGHCEKANRKGEVFRCLGCKRKTAHADHNAACNIARLGASVNGPHQQPDR